MKKSLLSLSLLAIIASSSASAMDKVSDENSLNFAIEAANSDSSIHEIVFNRKAHIVLSEPAIYTGTQSLRLVGNGAVIDGANVGERTDYTDPEEGTVTVKTTDGTLMFNTAANISIDNLSVVNSYTRGVVVSIPSDATGKDINVTLTRVQILNSGLYGLHLDDNDNEFDNGDTGSAIGINLSIKNSKFINNGTDAIDFDGIRVDERSEGGITANIIRTEISGNGGDGIELDEAGNGDVKATMISVNLMNNGAQNPEDLDDAFDIDEAGEGDLDVNLVNVNLSGNQDQGLDFDEEDEGSVNALLYRVKSTNNVGEAVKIDEEDDGDLNIFASNLTVTNTDDDGVQITEIGKGVIQATFDDVKVKNSKKYGVKIEQWLVEDEESQAEEQGSVQLRNVKLENNGKGDDLKLNGVTTN